MVGLASRVRFRHSSARRAMHMIASLLASSET
uniref:Uncharacterized protein n=1 Tax=Arundo donax TaxID=35708 RepID=A0A0A9B0R6_ARUDO